MSSNDPVAAAAAAAASAMIPQLPPMDYIPDPEPVNNNITNNNIIAVLYSVRPSIQVMRLLLMMNRYVGLKIWLRVSLLMRDGKKKEEDAFFVHLLFAIHYFILLP